MLFDGDAPAVHCDPPESGFGQFTVVHAESGAGW